MPLQRVRGAEIRADYRGQSVILMRNRLSNGPRRVQSNVGSGNTGFTEYSATCGHTSVARDMLVSCKVHGNWPVNARWHRG